MCSFCLFKASFIQHVFENYFSFRSSVLIFRARGCSQIHKKADLYVLKLNSLQDILSGVGGEQSEGSVICYLWKTKNNTGFYMLKITQEGQEELVIEIASRDFSQFFEILLTYSIVKCVLQHSYLINVYTEKCLP